MRSRVDIGWPLIIDLPSGAGGAAILEGSSATATVSGDRVTVTGPFAPGNTSAQVGFQLRHDRPNLTVQQTWPVPLQQLSVAAEKVGSLSISSPQFSTVGEVRSETGTPFLLGSGPALPAGATLTVQLSNLPVHSPTPRDVALWIAAIIIALGGWLGFASGGARRDLRPRLVARRDGLLAKLARLESRRRGPVVDDVRRQRLLAELEQVYGELDETHAPPRGGGEDVAA